MPQNKKGFPSREMQRARARYEGMRRDPSIKKIFPDLDTSQTFDQWMKASYEIAKEEMSKLYRELFQSPELLICPFYLDPELKTDENNIIINSSWPHVAIGHPGNSVLIRIDFDKVNDINDTIETIENEIKDIYKNRLQKGPLPHIIRIGIDLDIMYQIGDIIQNLRETDPRITWGKIADHCKEARLLPKDVEDESAEKTVKQHYWPRYQAIIRGGWRSL